MTRTLSELHKFIFEGMPVRGMLVRLTDAWQDILARRAANTHTGPYPAPVRQLLGEMDARGKAICIAERPAGEVQLRPLLDFGAGYVQRSIDSLPRQGNDYPWMMTFSYGGDLKMMKRSSVILPEMKLYDAPASVPAQPAQAEAA